MKRRSRKKSSVQWNKILPVLLAALLGVWLASCESASDVVRAGRQATDAVATVVAAGRVLLGEAPPLASGPTLPRPAGLPSARVTGVVDGDTVELMLGGREEKVRLIGMDTPETVDPRTSVQCYGREASDRAKQLLTGQTVWFEDDASQDTRDRYGRLLGYVWLPDGRLFNQVMIDEGFAFEYTYDKPYKYQAAFKASEQAAKSQQRGLWSPTTCNGVKRLGIGD